jgi:hypothetical protein
VYGTIAPRPALCSALSEQLHIPSVSAQAEVVQPTERKRFPILPHSVDTDETVRHAVASGNVTAPSVVVLSVYVPSALATNVPVV